MTILWVVFVIVIGYLISYSIHRTTLPDSIYSEKRKFQLSIVAQSFVLLLTIVLFTPVFFLTIIGVTISTGYILGFSFLVFIVASTIVIFGAKRIPQSKYWKISLSGITFVITSITILTTILFLFSETNPFLALGSQPINNQPTSSVGTGTPVPTNDNRVIGWIENHPETSKLIGTFITTLIGAVIAIRVAYIGRASKK